MEIIFKKIVSKTISGIGPFLNNSLTMFAKPTKFFRDIESSNEGFLNASAFALIASFILVLISIPSYKLNNIDTDKLFIVISVGISWFLLFFSGLQLFAIAKLFKGSGSMVKSISAYFYASSVLLILKVVEIPTRVVRDDALLSGPLTDQTTEKINTSINASSHVFTSELLVALGYIWFFILILSILRSVHNFGKVSTVFIGVGFMYLLSLTVSWIQTPILHILLNAFKLD